MTEHSDRRLMLTARGSVQKLNEDQVRRIRSDPRPLRQIARDYGVANSHIHRIKHRQNWRDLQ